MNLHQYFSISLNKCCICVFCKSKATNAAGFMWWQYSVTFTVTDSSYTCKFYYLFICRFPKTLMNSTIYVVSKYLKTHPEHPLCFMIAHQVWFFSCWLMSNLSRPETLWVPHQSLRLYKLPCSASEAGWTVNTFTMWTLLVLCSVIASLGVQGIVLYFLIVKFVSLAVDACATLTFCPVCLFFS